MGNVQLQTIIESSPYGQFPAGQAMLGSQVAVYANLVIDFLPDEPSQSPVKI